MQNRWLFTLAGLFVAAPTAFAANSSAGRSVDAMALYSKGAAVVQDSRTVDVSAGEQSLDWPTLGKIVPDTLWLSGSGVALKGFDIAGHTKDSEDRLASRVGRPVTLQSPDGKTRQGTLVDTKGETAYVRADDRILRITAASPVQISWSTGRTGSDGENSGDDTAQSGVTLHVSADKSGKQKLTALYQTAAPSWKASYTGRFDPDSGQLSLTAQAVIDNSGHGAFNADQAWLVAGDISRVAEGRPRPVMMAKMASSDSASAGQPQAVGNVYRYPLSDGLHVPAGAIQSVALMKPFHVDATRRYRFENSALSDSQKRQHARVGLSFDNASGQPIPAGVMRIYDAQHAAQLMGAARIGNTPKKAPVRLSLGSAFDITGTHRVARKSHRDDGAPVITVKVELFNAGDKAQRVTVVEHLPANAQLGDDAPETSGGSASQPEWQLSVPADGHKTLRYRFTEPKSS